MLEARPTYDPGTALLVVDVQNDFADPAGSLSVADGATVIPVLAAEIDAALAAGALVAYSQDWHPEVTPHFAKDGGVWPAHCVMQTWGAELHPDLPIAGHVVRKGSNGEDGYSAFTMRDPLSGETIETELDRLLRRRRVTRVVVGGLATDYCVVETGMDAVRLGYETILLLDAIRAVDLQPGDGDRAIERLRAAGVIVVARLGGTSGAASSGAADGRAAGAPAAAPTPAAAPEEGSPA
jgi:nicotinamidase/pyrazinamidase